MEQFNLKHLKPMLNRAIRRHRKLYEFEVGKTIYLPVVPGLEITLSYTKRYDQRWVDVYYCRVPGDTKQVLQPLQFMNYTTTGHIIKHVWSEILGLAFDTHMKNGQIHPDRHLDAKWCADPENKEEHTRLCQEHAGHLRREFTQTGILSGKLQYLYEIPVAF